MSIRSISILALALTVSSCSTTPINLPAVTGNGGSAALPGKVIWHDLLTDTPEKTRRFYSDLFGWTFEALDGEGGEYTLIRSNDELIGGMVNQLDLPTTADISQWVTVLAVRDAETAADALLAAGGTVFTPPTSLGARGTIAVVADPQGAVLALLQTDGQDPQDTMAPVARGTFLWDELWATDVDAATGFYQRMAPFEVRQLDFEVADHSISYRVLSSQDKPRVGIRPNPVPEMGPMWVNYLRVDDLAAMEAIVARVPALDGAVLSPPTERPEGGYVAVIAGPSGAGIALQTWPLEADLADRSR
jgi:predicted enzyme related to lactoylglutathione lyase